MTEEWHRHAYQFETFVDGVNRRIRGEPEKFQWCETCQCEPTTLLAPGPAPKFVGRPKHAQAQ